MGQLKQIAKPTEKSVQALLATILPSCAECTVVCTDRRCEQCNEPFCAPCFRTVHSSSRALGRHVLLPARPSTDVQIGAELQNCKFHANEEIDYFCQKCAMAICTKCRTERHAGHRNGPLLLEVDYAKQFFLFLAYICPTHILEPENVTAPA